MKTKYILVLCLSMLGLQDAHAFGRVIDGGSGGGSSESDDSGDDTSSSSSSLSSQSSSSSSTPSSSGTETVSKILTLAAGSSCASYSWKSRGRAPKGYIKGMALTYARSLCRMDDNRSDRRSPSLIMSKGQSGNISKDALAYMKSTFDARGLVTSRSGEDTLRSLYTLGIGLGMRESSGKYCEGWDVAAGSNRSSSEGEAGLFQSSYNSIAASAELKKLYSEYSANKNRCMLNTFKEGVSCRTQSILGSGAGATYQRFSRECPAFAAEYAMVMLRVLRQHYGPINRREAEITTACAGMLDQVESLVLANPSEVCSTID